jgi:hypothetical protein
MVYSIIWSVSDHIASKREAGWICCGSKQSWHTMKQAGTGEKKRKP